MPNLSQIKRQRMLDFLETLKRNTRMMNLSVRLRKSRTSCAIRNMGLFGRSIQNEWMRCSQKTFLFL